MVEKEDFGAKETTWCPGCGNFAIRKALKQALAELDLNPHEILMFSGIGQAAKMPHYLNLNMFNGLHGRSLSNATGAKVANDKLTVIDVSGDGCTYGEGGNHFLSTIRRNPDITLLVHNNQVYGLTKGQSSPTSEEEFSTKFQPHGVTASPFNPVAVAVAMRCSFVARSFAGFTDHLSEMIQKGIQHKGLALIDILQPCVSFNRLNTFAWYKKRATELPEDYDPTDHEAATQTAQEWGDRIPIGVIYRNDRTVFSKRFPVLSRGPLVEQSTERSVLREIMESYY